MELNYVTIHSDGDGIELFGMVSDLGLKEGDYCYDHDGTHLLTTIYWWTTDTAETDLTIL